MILVRRLYESKNPSISILRESTQITRNVFSYCSYGPEISIRICPIHYIRQLLENTMAQLARYKVDRDLSGNFLTRYGARFNSTLISVYCQRLPRTGAFLGVTYFVLLVKVAGDGRRAGGCTDRGRFMVIVPSRLRLVARGPVVSWWTTLDFANRQVPLRHTYVPIFRAQKKMWGGVQQ